MAVGSFHNLPYNERVFISEYKKLPDTFLENIINSGAVELDPALSAMISGQGNTFRMRYLNRLKDTDYQTFDGTTNMLFDEVDGGSYNAVSFTKMKGWKTNDYVDMFTDTDTMNHILSEMEDYKTKQRQKLFLGILDACFESTAKNTPTGNMTGWQAHTYDISKGSIGAPIDTNKFGALTIATAIQKACGDNGGEFKLVIMHSKIYLDLVGLNLIQFVQKTDPKGLINSIEIPTIYGIPIIVNDGVKVDTRFALAHKYSTYVLGKGVFKYGAGAVKHPIEFDRNMAENGGIDRVGIRIKESFVPVGFNYKGEDQISLDNNKTTTVAVPDTALKNKSNWELFVDHKAIKMVKIVTN